MNRKYSLVWVSGKYWLVEIDSIFILFVLHLIITLTSACERRLHFASYTASGRLFTIFSMFSFGSARASFESLPEKSLPVPAVY